MMRHTFILFICLALMITCTKPGTNPQPVQNKNSKKIVVGIIPLNSIDQNLVDFSAKEIEHFYGVEIQFMQRKPLPDTLKKPYAQRYNANKILVYLNQIKPKSFHYLLGLTDSKIATKKGKYKEWGILGLGQNPGPCCIVSTGNLGKNKKLFMIG